MVAPGSVCRGPNKRVTDNGSQQACGQMQDHAASALPGGKRASAAAEQVMSNFQQWAKDNEVLWNVALRVRACWPSQHERGVSREAADSRAGDAAYPSG